MQPLALHGLGGRVDDHARVVVHHPPAALLPHKDIGGGKQTALHFLLAGDEPISANTKA